MHTHEGEPQVSHTSLRTPGNFFEGVAFSLQQDRNHYPLVGPTRLVAEQAVSEERTLTGLVLPNEPDFRTWIPDNYSDENYLVTLGYSILRNNTAFLMAEFGEARIDRGEFPGLVKGLLDLSDKEMGSFFGEPNGAGRIDLQSKYETAFLTARFLVDALGPVHGDNFGEVIRTDSDSYHHKSILSESATNPRFVVGRIYEDMHWGKTS